MYLNEQLLATIAKEKIPEEIRAFLFKYCLAAFEKQIYSGWDWHIGMLNIASEILKDDIEAERIITYLDKIQGSEYEKEGAQSIKFRIIKKTKGEKEADKFLEQNLANPNLRREAIAKALKNKDYEKAIGISKDGLKEDGKSKPGLAMEWHDWLLKTAQAQKDKEKIITYARLLFIADFRNEQDYYQLLQTNVPTGIWPVFVEEMIKDIALKKRWSDFDLITQIFIREQWWQKLLELVKNNPSLTHIAYYEKYLSKEYPAELVLLYGEAIIAYMKKNVGRNHYQTACKYLRRMIKLGGRESAEKIISDFRKQYPQRRALMEELNRV